jgi:hypothetical protein
MSSATSPPLPSFLPFPGEQLRNLFPLGHNALADVLGLALAYLKGMHPSKIDRKDPKTAGSAHILSLLLNDPLIKSLLPSAPPTTTPTKEFSALQGRLTSLENTISALAKVTATAAKKPQPPAQPPAHTPQSGRHGPTLTPATYAQATATPPRPSIVVGAAGYTWSDSRPMPSDICATLNRTIGKSHPQTQLSTAKWTKNGNLVIWGGPNTTAHHLTTALPHITEVIQASFSMLSDTAPSNPPPIHANIKWSKLTINNAPTGKSPTQAAHSPDECHQALLSENPAYASLTITQ